MGLGILKDAFFKRKFRWLFYVNGVNNDQIIGDGFNALPPSKASRPNISFKSAQFEHLNETISFPVKPEWKPINITLFDIKCKLNPIWDNWLNLIYRPKEDKNNYSYPINQGAQNKSFKRDASLKLFDGCGKMIESWIFESAYPEDINFDELNMDENGIVNINLTLKYDRAYIESYAE